MMASITMAIKTYPVGSSCISEFVYDDETEQLQFTFVKGGTYTIQGFPESQLQGWMNYASIGAYFNLFVRGQY